MTEARDWEQSLDQTAGDIAGELGAPVAVRLLLQSAGRLAERHGMPPDALVREFMAALRVLMVEQGTRDDAEGGP